MANGDIEVTSTATSSTQVSKPTTNVASGAVSALGAGAGVASLLSAGTSGFKLPMGNPLHKYASYTQIFTLAALSAADMAKPEQTYLKGGVLPIILKTSGSPNNRQKTAYGAFDFFVDSLEIKSVYGFTQGLGNTNATMFDMTVSEPYSMGMFPIALNVAAQKAGYNSFSMATFLLKIEFKGEDQNGNMVAIPNTTKYLPIQIRRLDMSVNEGGSIYKVQAHASADVPHLKSNATLTSNIAIVGSTVEEILTRGRDSLQAVINRRLREIAFKAEVPVADEIVIIFPDASTNLTQSAPGEDELDKSRPAVTPDTKTKVAVSTDTKLFSSLNLSRGTNETLLQTQINAIGSSTLGYGTERWGKTPLTPTLTAVGADGKMDKRKVTQNSKVSEYSFPQDTTIQNAINQVIMTSDYAIKVLNAGADDKGMYKWWRIETSVFDIDTTANDKKTGTKPKLLVYKVVPYMVHETNMPIPGVSSTTFEKLLKQCVKVYNYIFTGKNQDILKFNIDFDTKFMVAITSDLGNLPKPAADKAGAQAAEGGQDGGAPKKSGGWNYQTTYSATHTNQDRQGKGGNETPETRSVRMLHDALTYGYDLQNIEIDIVGDPYYLTGNGLGNYNSPADPDHMNINKDGSINYQNGEVDIAINFKTPLDINSSTGLYNMAGKSVGEFSGLYKLRTVVHKFKAGQFTQTISGTRRPMTIDDTGKTVFKLNSKEEKK